jgi:tetratricopeptide (TPR) repeat protein
MRPRLDTLTRHPLPLLFGTALALRLLYLLDIRHNPFFYDPILDLYAYDSWAQQLAAGHWLGDHVFYQSPLYPYFLAVIYFLCGHKLLLVYLLQALLGSLDCLLIAAIGTRLFERRVGILAGFLAALYKPFLFYDGLLLKTFLEVLLLDLSLWLLLLTCAKRRLGLALLAGLALGLGALGRDNYLALAPFLAVWLFFALAKNPIKLRLGLAALFLAGFCAIVALTAYRNYRVGHDLVLITSQGGQNFYIGNHRDNYWGVYQAPPFLRANPLFEETDFRAEAVRRTGRKDWKPSALSNFWFQQTWEVIQSDPRLFLARLGRKTLLFFSHQEISDNLSYPFFAQNFSWMLRLPLPSSGLIFPLGLLGLGLALRRQKGRLLALVIAVYGVSVIFFFVFSRYRLQVAPELIIFAGFALFEAYRFFREQQFRALLIALVALVGLSAVTQLNLVHENLDNAYFNLGNHYFREHRYPEAVAMYEKASQMAPNRYHYFLALGLTYLQLQNPDMAIINLRQAVELEPKMPDAHLYLGEAYLQKGLDMEALFDLRLAAALDPANVESRLDLGQLFEKVGRSDQARDYYQEVLKLDPANPAARQALERLRLSGH